MNSPDSPAPLTPRPSNVAAGLRRIKFPIRDGEGETEVLSPECCVLSEGNNYLSPMR